MKATVSRKASKQNATASPNTGFAAHFVRPNASHFAKPENVRRHSGVKIWKLGSDLSEQLLV